MSDIWIPALIVFFGVLSYVIGFYQIATGKYAPSAFTRIVWLFLTINSFAAVWASHASSASILLGAILLAGNVLICVGSIWKGSREFGHLERLCSVLLLGSALVWVFFDAPLVNLAIGLTAHFIGAIPTYDRVIKNPHNESPAFWSLFFIASLLSVYASRGEQVEKVLLPLYCTVLDGSLFILSLRRRKAKQTARHIHATRTF